MVEQARVEHPRESRYGTAGRDVLPARARVSRGMVMHHPYGPHNVLIYMIYFA